MNSSNHPVVLFDGVCNLCNATVQFIIRRDKKNRFRFAPLQSAYGHKIKQTFDLDSNSLDSVVLIVSDRLYLKSEAALQIAKRLDGLWPIFFFFKIIPKFIRDAIYDWIARNRYRWFGKKETCMIPPPNWHDLFLGD